MSGSQFETLVLLLAYNIMLYKGGIFVNSSRSIRQNRDDYYNSQVVEGSLQGGVSGLL